MDESRNDYTALKSDKNYLITIPFTYNSKKYKRIYSDKKTYQWFPGAGGGEEG